MDCTFEDTVYNPKSYRCHLAIIREDDASFSAIALNLPGAGSIGDTEEDARCPPTCQVASNLPQPLTQASAYGHTNRPAVLDSF